MQNKPSPEQLQILKTMMGGNGTKSPTEIKFDPGVELSPDEKRKLMKAIFQLLVELM